MPDTMWMGMPGTGQGRPQRSMLARSWGPSFQCAARRRRTHRLNALNCGAFEWKNPNAREFIWWCSKQFWHCWASRLAGSSSSHSGAPTSSEAARGNGV